MASILGVKMQYDIEFRLIIEIRLTGFILDGLPLKSKDLCILQC